MEGIIIPMLRLVMWYVFGNYSPVAVSGYYRVAFNPLVQLREIP
jgi:hypothetical protein